MGKPTTVFHDHWGWDLDVTETRVQSDCFQGSRLQDYLHLEREPIVELSKTSDFGSESEIAQVQILSVIVPSTLYYVESLPVFCLIRSSHRPVAHEDGQNKA
ncbi:hypothetical protein J6590_064879 [Homalodisca vitripennis]|nr:hypothetical protein J6590_064879 [Homalodisca vitripennis]